MSWITVIFGMEPIEELCWAQAYWLCNWKHGEGLCYQLQCQGPYLFILDKEYALKWLKYQLYKSTSNDFSIYWAGEMENNYYWPEIMLTSLKASDMNKSAWIIALDSMVMHTHRIFTEKIIIVTYDGFVSKLGFSLDHNELELMANATVRRFRNYCL